MAGRGNPYQGDARTRQARADGYPARSVYKLEEIDNRFRLLYPGARVVDLGAAPGSWTSYSAKRVGGSGSVVAIDIQPLKLSPLSNVTVFVGDAFELGSKLESCAPYDVILSDMAPSTSGSKVRDQTRSFELFMLAVGVAERLGTDTRTFVGKLFMGPDFERARDEIRRVFGSCRVVKPKGTRQNSAEVFLVGQPKAPR